MIYNSKQKLVFASVIARCLFLEIVIGIPLTIIGAILLLPACYLTHKNNSVILPKYLRWFDSADWFVGRDTSVILRKWNDGWWSWYCYIAWRNPLNYFSYVVLGVKTDKIDKAITDIWFTSKNPRAPWEIGDTQNAGYQIGDYIINGKQYYELYFVIRYSLFGKAKCLRMRFGHKLGKVPEIDKYYSYVCVISPFSDYVGAE